MRIERIDDKTVKCFLSNEELEEYDIDYKDFVMRSEKAREIVQEIIEQAEEEVGYRPPKFAFDLQIMMLPEQGMILTFSEKEPTDIKDAAPLLETLRGVKQMLQKKREELESTGMTQDADSAENKYTGQPGKVVEKALEKPIVQRPENAVFVFDRIASVMEFARVLPRNLRVSSALYEMDELFYLYLGRGSASYERYGRTCVQALEFGYLYTAEENQMRHLEEHAECLIADHALKKLGL